MNQHKTKEEFMADCERIWNEAHDITSKAPGPEALIGKWCAFWDDEDDGFWSEELYKIHEAYFETENGTWLHVRLLTPEIAMLPRSQWPPAKPGEEFSTEDLK